MAECSSFAKPPCVTEQRLLFKKAAYWVRARWRQWRITPLATKIFGCQYARSREQIEIDITYDCNLMCQNCNRSVQQAPEKLHIPLESIQHFVDESIGKDKRWSRIRVLGGEPTLHPQFLEVVNELLRYHDWHPQCIIEVVTNGHGPFVQSQLAMLPAAVWVENSRKVSPVQMDFTPFNMAPVDDSRYRKVAYANGCAIMSECGMGLTPMGYYPCAISGGIDRITGQGLGRPSLPDDSDDMRDLLTTFCCLCGRFKDGHYVPRNLRPSLRGHPVSPAWERLYAEWQRGKEKRQQLIPTGRSNE